MNRSIADIRFDYKLKTLNETDVADTPLQQFSVWWKEAVDSEIFEVNAMTLATVDKGGAADARIVLLKDFTNEGFVFFTNYQSNKGRQIENNEQVCLLFFWKELERQVKIKGVAEKISAADSDAYFCSRPLGSRIGAWCSPQSEHISSRAVLEENVRYYTGKFADGEVPRPPHWGGYLIRPVSVEFWQGRSSRLHDRLLYLKENDGWKLQRLAP